MTWTIRDFVRRMDDCDPRDGLLEMMVTHGYRAPDNSADDTTEEVVLNDRLRALFEESIPFMQKVYALQEDIFDYYDKHEETNHE